jgi:hypothetical protein
MVIRSTKSSRRASPGIPRPNMPGTQSHESHNVTPRILEICWPRYIHTGPGSPGDGPEKEANAEGGQWQHSSSVRHTSSRHPLRPTPGGVVGIWRSTARCYLNPTLTVFSRGLLHSQTRRLQAIAGLPQGHEGTERNHDSHVGGSSPDYSPACSGVADSAAVSVVL